MRKAALVGVAGKTVSFRDAFQREMNKHAALSSLHLVSPTVCALNQKQA